jgi:hypothetical protein
MVGGGCGGEMEAREIDSLLTGTMGCAVGEGDTPREYSKDERRLG